MKVQPVQPVSSSEYDFDNEQLYNASTGKTICDLDSSSFQEILKNKESEVTGIIKKELSTKSPKQ